MKPVKFKLENDLEMMNIGVKGGIFETIRDRLEREGVYELIIQKEERKRTTTQNKSIFKYYRIIAGKLNAAGFTMRSFFSALKKGFEIPVNMENVRDVAEKVSIDMFGKPVKELKTTEIQELHRTIDKGFSLSMGVSSEFPSDTPPVYEGTR